MHSHPVLLSLIGTVTKKLIGILNFQHALCLFQFLSGKCRITRPLTRPFTNSVMTKKNAILVAIALVAVSSIYYYLYKDYFTKADIQIIHTIRPRPIDRRRGQPPKQGNAITFGFQRDYKLTSIKVVPVSDIETNKYPHP